jgi:hypothetical protein
MGVPKRDLGCVSYIHYEELFKLSSLCYSPENTSVGNGEGSSSHILNGELSVTGLLSKTSDGRLNSDHVEGLCVANDGGNKSLLGGNSDGDVDVVTVDDGVTTVRTLNRGVNSGDILHSLNNGLGESGHESELNTSLLEDGILVELAHLHKSGHVNLVEGSQGSGGVLGLLQTLSNTETHAVHLDAALLTVSESGGSGSGGGRSSGGLLLGGLGGGSGSLSLLLLGSGGLLLRSLSLDIGGGLGLLLCGLLLCGLGLGGSSSLGGRSGGDLQEVLSDNDGVLLGDEKLGDGSGNGRVDSNVNLESVSMRISGGANNAIRHTLSVSMVAISSSCSTKSPTSIGCISVYSGIPIETPADKRPVLRTLGELL